MPALSSHDLRSDVVVIGGGAIGTSIAYHLARRRIDVILVERDDIASGTSGACDGFIFMQSKKPDVHLQMALESARMMERLSTELQRDIEYEKSGGMIVVKSRKDMPEMRKLVERQRKVGLEVDLLDAHQAREMEPCLSSGIAGATYSPTDAQVNPMSLCFAFAEAAKRMGAEVLTHTEVTDVPTTKGKVEGVVTSKGVIRADVVVNAAGVYAPVIGKMVGVELPITPRRGQVLVTEPVPQLLKRVMICSRYITSKFNSRRVQGSLGVGLALEQTRAGSLLIGSTREFVGYDRTVTPEGIQAVLEHASALVPIIGELNVIRAFAGLRPHTPDGMPILGKVDGVEGFIMAAGHEGDGIALSPITGFLIAELIATGEMPIEYYGKNRQE
jgi:glycine/D-amino acid oxidase-like deaminating enzyme